MLTAVTGLFVFAAVALAVVAAGRYMATRPTDAQRAAARRLQTFTSDDLPGPAQTAAGPELRAAAARLAETFGERARGLLSEPGSELRQAGFTGPSAPTYYQAIRLAAVIAGAAAFGMMAVAWKGRPAKILGWAAGGAAVGLIAPPFVLGSLVKRRQRQIRNGLPDALDVLVLCVEGGSGLAPAVNWVADEIGPAHPALGEEFDIVRREMQLGMTPAEAFQAFADRTGIPDARDLATAVQQSERYGAGLAKGLRSYSDAARQDRAAWAEEVAQKAAVKVMFPMLICIFPAMFIVLLGPAAMQMSKLFAR